jgi:hypothetical protein
MGFKETDTLLQAVPLLTDFDVKMERSRKDVHPLSMVTVTSDNAVLVAGC